MTQNINVTLHPLNKFGVPLTDVMDYPSRGSSSSVGSEGTFYIKKSNQGVYLVETKLNSVEVPAPTPVWQLAWNWSFGQTTNLCDPGITILVHYDEAATMSCPYVATINATPYLRYNTTGYVGAFGNIGGTTGAYLTWTHLSNYPTNVSKLVLDVSATGDVYYVFETTAPSYIRRFITISGNPLAAEPSLGWDVDEFFTGSEAIFDSGTIAYSSFGSVGTGSTFSFRDVSFYRQI